MTRVSENSNTNALNYAINRAKQKLEDLQLKGSTLKNITRPSDNPIANVDSLTIVSKTKDNKQYIENSNNALLYLGTTEKALDQITEILQKSKELAIQQSSDFYNEDIRKNIANDVIQMRNNLLAIANKRVGNRYIFSGFNTLQKPFNHLGNYNGDQGQITTEVAKDFFIPSNLSGKEVFFYADAVSNRLQHPLQDIKEFSGKNLDVEIIRDDENEKTDALSKGRDLASVDDDQKKFEERSNLFALLTTFITSLENNDPETIRGLLEKFDDGLSRVITLRTRIGSLTNLIGNMQSVLESENIEYDTQRSKLMDADVTELFSDLQKQQELLKVTYQSGKNLINQSLLDFLR